MTTNPSKEENIKLQQIASDFFNKIGQPSKTQPQGQPQPQPQPQVKKQQQKNLIIDLDAPDQVKLTRSQYKNLVNSQNNLEKLEVNREKSEEEKISQKFNQNQKIQKNNRVAKKSIKKYDTEDEGENENEHQSQNQADFSDLSQSNFQEKNNQQKTQTTNKKQTQKVRDDDSDYSQQMQQQSDDEDKDEDYDQFQKKTQKLKKNTKNYISLKRKNNTQNNLEIQKQTKLNDDIQDNEQQDSQYDSNNKLAVQEEEEVVQKPKTIADFVIDSLAKAPRKKAVRKNLQKLTQKAKTFKDESHSSIEDEDEADENSGQNQDFDNFNNYQLKPFQTQLQQQQQQQYQYQQNQQQDKKKKLFTTSCSFTKRPNTMNKKWNDKETQHFYRFLQIFGTDFTTIQKYLQTKTVTQIKNKFNKEEKKNPQKITEVLNNPRKSLLKKINNMDQFQIIKNHYDQKHNVQNRNLKNLMMIKNSPEKSELNNDMENEANQDQKFKLLQFQHEKDDNNNNDDDEDQDELNDDENQDFDNEQFLQNQLKKENPMLTAQNLQLLTNSDKKQIIDYPTRNRKDSQTSIDSVARIIFENVIQQYNKEAEAHNNTNKSYSFPTNSQNQNNQYNTNINKLNSNLTTSCTASVNPTQIQPNDDSGDFSSNTSLNAQNIHQNGHQYQFNHKHQRI